MTGETPFRLLLAAAAVIQAAVSLWLLWGAGAAATVFRRREEGLVLTAGIALSFLAYVVAVVAWLLNPASMAWSAVAIPAGLRWTGTIPLILGACAIVQAQRHLGRNITISISTKVEHALVTTGPYGWVRHPLYSAGMVESAGVGLLTANWFIVLTAALFWMLIAYRTPMEERKLLDRFGDDYRNYIRRVGRFVPRLTKSR